MTIKSKSGIFKPKLYTTTLINKEPNIVQEALNDKHWYEAMNEEYEALIRNETWSLIKPGWLQKGFNKLKESIILKHSALL